MYKIIDSIPGAKDFLIRSAKDLVTNIPTVIRNVFSGKNFLEGTVNNSLASGVDDANDSINKATDETIAGFKQANSFVDQIFGK